MQLCNPFSTSGNYAIDVISSKTYYKVVTIFLLTMVTPKSSLFGDIE